MEGQNPVTLPDAKKSQSWIVWAVLVAAIVLAAALILWRGPAVRAPEIGTEDTTSAISAQLDRIDIRNLEAELQSIDQELNQL